MRNTTHTPEKQAQHEACKAEAKRVPALNVVHSKRLYSCTAEILVCEDGTIALRSYAAIVATYKDGTTYDFLRFVYGYTATSAKHVAKFRRWLTEHNFPVTHNFTYHP